MDDLTKTTLSVLGFRWIPQGLERLITWAQMHFKLTKSRSLVLKRGDVSNRFRFFLGDTQSFIIIIHQETHKSCGKTFNSTLWLMTVDKTGLQDKFNAWIFQHSFHPRILWPLLVYEFLLSMMESFERRISHHFCRWLGLPQSVSSIALYGHKNKLLHPISSHGEEFMVIPARVVLQHRESSDLRFFQAGIKVRTGWKWRAQDEVEQADSRLCHSMQVGSVACGQAGLRSIITICYNKAQGKDRHRLVQREVRARVEDL